MSVKTFHILDTAFFPPFPKEFHPCRWLYNLQTWINISKFAYLVVGSFLTVKALPLFWLWGVFKHLQFSMSSGNGPLSKPPKPSCSVCPSPPCHSRCTSWSFWHMTSPHGYHVVLTLCAKHLSGQPLLFCPHWHSPGGCSLRIRLPTTSLSTAPTLPSLHQKELLQEGIWLYPSLSRTVWWLPATFVIKVRYHNLTSKWFMNSSQVAFPASSSPTHIPFPWPSCSSHIELFLQTHQTFSSLCAFFPALCLAFLLVSAEGLVRAWTLETECLNSYPISALGMILVLLGVQPEADSETKSQQFIWRFRKYQ